MTLSAEVTLPSEREVSVTRTFDAPARAVFACHTEPEKVKRWLLGPPGWTMPVCEIDLRVGGGYRYTWRNAATGNEFSAVGTFNEIVAPTRMVHSERMEMGQGPSPEGEALITWTLTEAGGRTTLRTTMRFPSQEIRDQALASGMTDGMAVSYNHLADLMAEAIA